MKTPLPERRASPTDAAKLLFSNYHLQLLAVLYMRPEDSFHVRELERLTGLSVGTAHRELARMRKTGLIMSERVGNLVRYRADRACPIFPEVQGIVRKTVGLADVLREALAPLSSRIDIAFVFGSIAADTAGPHSDVDLIIVGDIDFAEVVGAMHELEPRLGRAVNPIVLDPAGWKKRRNDSAFVARVLRGPVIPLIGAINDA